MKWPLTIGTVAFCLAVACCKKSGADRSAADGSARETPERPARGAGRGSAGGSDAAVQNPYARDHWSTANESANRWTDEFKAAAAPQGRIDVIERKQASGPEMLAPLVRLALQDGDERVRSEAVKTIRSFAGWRGSVVAPAAGGNGGPEPATARGEIVDLVVAAAHDPSSEVRVLAMEAALELETGTQLEIYRKTIAVPDATVRKMTITELGRMMSKPAFEVLLTGLQHPEPDFREQVNGEIQLLVNRKFGSFEQAQVWWDANAGSFNDKMIDTGGTR